MSGTVVSIFSDWNGQVSFNLHSASGEIEHARDLYRFDCTTNEQAFLQMHQLPPTADEVKSAGRRLFEALEKHPAVKDAITAALMLPQESVAPLYIYLNVDNDQIEGLPWESLYAAPPGMFLALDTRWPIARVADSSAIVPEIERTFQPPLKVMAILSAAGVDATPEWKEFYEAIKNASELNLQVFVCQPELKGLIEGLGDKRVTVQYVTTKSDLFAAVNTFDPHILHFFCHGSTDGGAHLQLANRQDWVGENPRGSIALGKEELTPFCSKERNIWLVTLNCCQGAAAAEDSYSLARSLVTKGFPAVIGMRELIATEDAHLFCTAFYAAVVQEVGQWKGKGQDVHEVEWAKVLCQPRIQLCDKHSGDLPRITAAAASKEWTLPVIYVRPEPFKIRMSSVPSTPVREIPDREVLEATLKKLREFKVAVPDLPQSTMEELDKRISDLEKQLYPN